MKERSAKNRIQDREMDDGKADATGCQRVRLMEDGFRRSLGLGLWISKDEAWWIDLIGGSLKLRVRIDSTRY